MALDDLTDLIGNALRALDRRQRAAEESVAGVHARLTALLDVLEAREVIGAGNKKHIERCAQNAGEVKPKVRLRMHDADKYNMIHGDPVDCADRLALCRARCCTFAVVLSEQDLAEGKVQWELHEPYVLKRDADSRCVYQHRDTGFCTNYEHRPATCRSYSCKTDRRIWLDFDNKIPAPPLMTTGNDEAEPG